jgi:hypothetical protein
MLTLEQARPIAERLGPDANSDREAKDTTGFHGSMASDSYVADAVCHLLSGFLIVQNLGGAPSRTLRPSATPLEVVSQNICTALEALNECSLEFWLLPQVRNSTSARAQRFRNRLNFRRDAPVDHAVDRRPREQTASESVTQAPAGGREFTHQTVCGSIIESEWEKPLAAAILQLVGAYRAMEILSESAFPAGAPRSFALACHCLCTALATLDTCLAGCEIDPRTFPHVVLVGATGRVRV